MKKIIQVLTICFFINILLANISYGAENKMDFLDIKIGNSTDYFKQYTLESNTGFKFYEKRNKNLEVYNIQDEMVYASLNIYGEIEIISLENEIIYSIPSDGSIIIGSESLVKVDKNKYRDYITFLERDNKLSLINHINMEHYLYGVVPKEMPASWPVESLKAQAVVARSFALSNLNKHAKEGFNLCDTTDCQVYKAYDNEHPNTNQAVDETKGEYVYYNGKVASTPYHSTSGGYTEDSSVAWGGSIPYLIPVYDVYSEGTASNIWSINITPLEIKNKLSTIGINIGDIKDIIILNTSSANRVVELKIVGSNGDHIMNGNKMRTLLGNTTMKSTWFEIDKKGQNLTKKVYVIDDNLRNPVEVNINSTYILDGKSNTSSNRNNVSRAIGSDRTINIEQTLSITPTTFIFNGKGYGHGVGMSQFGAMEMAKLGYKYEDIIKHYYTGVEIIKTIGEN
jgi:stage II sporulation protein D